MQAASITVGVTAVEVPVQSIGDLRYGMRLLARSDNSGDVYIGTASSVTTSTGVLLPKGLPETSLMFTIPIEHFTSGISSKKVYLIGSGAGQVVDWSAQ